MKILNVIIATILFPTYLFAQKSNYVELKMKSYDDNKDSLIFSLQLINQSDDIIFLYHPDIQDVGVKIVGLNFQDKKHLNICSYDYGVKGDFDEIIRDSVNYIIIRPNTPVNFKLNISKNSFICNKQKIKKIKFVNIYINNNSKYINCRDCNFPIYKEKIEVTSDIKL